MTAKRNNKESKKLKRVLYFDDEPFVAKSLTVNLELFGWDVKLVSEIEDLFKELETNKYDILMLDIMLPVPEATERFTEKEISQMEDGVNTGVVIVKKIWGFDEYKQLPIMFLSAKKDPRSDDSKLLNNRCDYLRKPELAKTVNAKLEELIKNNNTTIKE